MNYSYQKSLLISKLSKNSKKLKLFCLVLLVFILAVFNSSNIIIGNNEKNNFIHRLFPQGWSFFTKSPRSEMLDIYHISGNNLTNISIRNMSKNSYFGFSRVARRIAYESSLIAEKVDKYEWIDTVYLDIEKFASSITHESICTSTNIKKPKNVNNLKSGEYLLILHRPKPWFYFSCDLCVVEQKFKYSFVNIME